MSHSVNFAKYLAAALNDIRRMWNLWESNLSAVLICLSEETLCSSFFNNHLSSLCLRPLELIIIIQSSSIHLIPP